MRAWSDSGCTNDGILNASLYAGFDSWLGPMLFGFGWREGGNGLEIGRPF